MNIKITTPALLDLEELREYLAPLSPKGLASVLAEIEEAITNIPQNVASGRKTPRDDVREKITRKFGFIIPYHVRADTVYVLRIYRGMRKPLDYETIVQLD